MKRLLAQALLACIVATACVGGAAAPESHPATTHRGPITLRLKPGTYTYLIGANTGDSSAQRLLPGDTITCVTTNGSPAGGGVVPAPGHGVGSSTGFDLSVTGGKVNVTCPADVGSG